MAEIDVVILLCKLNELLMEESLVNEVKDQIRGLQTELKSMCSFLREVDEKRGDVINEAAEGIINLARHADHVIDIFICSSLGQNQKQLMETFIGFEANITQIKSRMREIYSNQTKYGIIRCTQFEEVGDNLIAGERRPIVKEPYMLRREHVMLMLLDHLIKGEFKLAVVSIVGAGKTTLARNVYSSVYIKNYFDCRAWARVPSGCKQYKEVLKGLMKCLMPPNASIEVMDGDGLQRTLSNYLSNKRYFIVIDDISSESWEDLKEAFPDDGNGSRILLVGMSTGQNIYRFDIPLLDKEERWELFCHRVFGDGNCPPELEQVGRSLVDLSHGRPSAILLLAGLFSKKEKTYLVWLKLEADLLRCLLAQCHSKSLKYQVLHRTLFSNSYNGSPHLKFCFLYFGVFPKDFEISTRQLFQLWIAEGFIQDNSEAIAEGYLEELVDKGMVIMVRRRSNGKIRKCRINSCLLTFIKRTAGEARFLQVVSYHGYPNSLRVDFQRNAINEDSADFINLEALSLHSRSLLCFAPDKDHLTEQLDKHIGFSFRLLRVLDLNFVVLDHLPHGIGNLIYLRYLRLNVPSLRSIPSSLCNLRNLYTLDMPSSHISSSPDDIWNMQNLRHLNFGSISISAPHPGKDCISLACLDHLSTLSPSSCTQDVFGSLPNLQTLQIYGDLGSQHKVLSKSLIKLHCLKSLRLAREADSSTQLPMVLTDFQFPPSLTQLTLWNTELKDDPMPTLEKLPNLQVLKLKHNSYWGRKLTCSSGGFPKLQVLHLKTMQWLKEWTMGTESMPCLVCLVINPCAYLRRLPEEIWHLKSLCKLELWWPRPELKPRLREIEEMDRYNILIYPSGL
uniref:Putative disease resistance RPP8-like protein 3 n=1 Tax=Davidia involucrata TaxID=16924 RepID=A0A5B7BUI5_DAVIN